MLSYVDSTYATMFNDGVWKDVFEKSESSSRPGNQFHTFDLVNNSIRLLYWQVHCDANINIICLFFVPSTWDLLVSLSEKKLEYRNEE